MFPAVAGVAYNQVLETFNPLTMRTKENEYSKLKMEIADTKVWLSEVKLFIDKMLRSRINLCTLADFIDVVNAVQMFFYTNFANVGAVEKALLAKFPEWYRVELQHGNDHIHRGMSVVMAELAAYVQLASDALLAGDDEVTLDEVKRQIRDRQSECGAFALWYRKNYITREKWDVCPVCDRPGTGDATTLQKNYERMMNASGAPDNVNVQLQNMQRVRETTLASQPIPFDDIVLGTYIEKWLPRKLRKPTQQMHLGNLVASVPAPKSALAATPGTPKIMRTAGSSRGENLFRTASSTINSPSLSRPLKA